MRLAVSTFAPSAVRRTEDPQAGFSVKHVLTLVLLLVTLPVLLIGAVVALPVGAAVLSFELARSAFAAVRRN